MNLAQPDPAERISEPRPLLFDCASCGAAFDFAEMRQIVAESPVGGRPPAVMLTCPVCGAVGQFEGPR